MLTTLWNILAASARVTLGQVKIYRGQLLVLAIVNALIAFAFVYFALQVPEWIKNNPGLSYFFNLVLTFVVSNTILFVFIFALNTIIISNKQDEYNEYTGLIVSIFWIFLLCVTVNYGALKIFSKDSKNHKEITDIKRFIELQSVCPKLCAEKLQIKGAGIGILSQIKLVYNYKEEGRQLNCAPVSTGQSLLNEKFMEYDSIFQKSFGLSSKNYLPNGKYDLKLQPEDFCLPNNEERDRVIQTNTNQKLQYILDESTFVCFRELTQLRSKFSGIARTPDEECKYDHSPG